MDTSFIRCRVHAVRSETDQATTLFLDTPDGQPGLQFEPGQYLTVRVFLQGKEHRRAYSISSSTLDNHVGITVKKVNKGLVSGFLVSGVQPGDELEIMPAQGRFTVPPQTGERRTFYLFGAGSGITPLMSIIRHLLEQEPQSTIHLLYGNRDESQIIFREELDNLSQRYAGQLTVQHTLSQPLKTKSEGAFSFLKKGVVQWQGAVGRIDAAKIDQFLEENPLRANRKALYLVCGPGDMIDTVKAALSSRSIPEKDILSEYFSAPIAQNTEQAQAQDASQNAEAIIHLHGKRLELTLPAEKTILDSLLKKGYNPPYSCMSGACSTCMAKVVTGSVQMEVCFALDKEEIEAGYILTCQAQPTSAQLEITYEV